MEFNGKPMIAWTITAAMESGAFDDILVSTDSEKIAAVSKKWGASVPFLRDSKYADDYTPVSVATIKALEQIEKLRGLEYDNVVQLMPNCPLRNRQDIRQAFNHFKDSRSNFQISVFRFGWMNPWWAMTRDSATGIPEPLFSKALKRRSQDLPPLYCPTGAIWIAKAQALKRENSFYGEGYTTFPMDWMRAIDIDDTDDLSMAHMINNLLNTKNSEPTQQAGHS